MPKRRANGEGTIFQRQDGRWCAKIYLDGRIHMTYGASQRECTDWLLEIRQRIGAGDNIGNRSTVAEYLEHWLNATAASVRPRTAIQYRQIVKDHILPQLGRLRLDHLRPDQVQLLYNRRLESGVSPRTVQLVHAVLHRALKQALLWGIVTRNVADAVHPPARDDRPQRRPGAAAPHHRPG